MEEMLTKKPLHVLLVCFPGQGHINPFLRLAKVVASKGLLVTFSTNESTGHRMTKATGNVVGALMPVGKGHLRFEFFDDGVLATDDLDSMMLKLETAGPAALESLIRRQADESRPVACIVNNPFLPWVGDVAAGMGIRSSLLWVQSCGVFSAYWHYSRCPEIFPDTDEGWSSFEVALPGLPPLKAEDLPSFLLPSNPYKSLTKVILQQMEKLSSSSCVLVESFEELERPALEAATAILPPPPRLLPVGPLAKLVQTAVTAVRGDLWTSSDECIEWLDACPPASVLYVSVGSVVVLSEEQVAEIARGLRDSGRRFLWVVKPARGSETTGVPEGFEAEVAGRGLLVQWSPQERVLAHPAVAGFLTHCGWNSTLEALTAGKPVVAFPQWGDQVTDAKFLVDVYGVGVRMLEATAAEVRRCVEELFEGTRAEEMREKAAQWRERAAAAVAEGGSSDRNVQVFVDDLLSGCGTQKGDDSCPLDLDGGLVVFS